LSSRNSFDGLYEEKCGVVENEDFDEKIGTAVARVGATRMCEVSASKAGKVAC
jgi:hypothetical protein